MYGNIDTRPTIGPIRQATSSKRYIVLVALVLFVGTAVALGIYFGFKKPASETGTKQYSGAGTLGTYRPPTTSGAGTGTGTGTGAGTGTGVTTGGISDNDITAYGERIVTDRRVWIRSALGGFLCIVPSDTDRGPTLSTTDQRGSNAAHWIIRKNEDFPTLFTIANATDAVGTHVNVIGLPNDMASKDGAELIMQRYPLTVFRFSDAGQDLTYLRIHSDGSKFLTLDTVDDKIVQRNPDDEDEMKWFVIPIRDELVGLPILSGAIDASPSGQVFWITNAEGKRFTVSSVADGATLQATTDRSEVTGRKFVLVASEDEGFYFIRATSSVTSDGVTTFTVPNNTLAINSSGGMYLRNTAGNDAQFWFMNAGNGYFYIHIRQNNECLSTSDSAVVRGIVPLNRSTNIIWRFEY